MGGYRIPAEEVRIEILVVNSRFIATLTPVFSVEAAKTFIKRIKSEFDDASHNVPAYLIGHGATVTAHCNDDGEPSGTAGRPALAVLQGSGLGDVAVVITRYFGGTKLGKGGLVRAYGDAVREVINEVPLAEKILTDTIMIGVPYNFLERVRLSVIAHNGTIVDEDFAAEITMTVDFPVEDTPKFQGSIQELSAGKLSLEVLDTGEKIVPMNKHVNK
jgi:uncharacterized YigZ family protein